MKVQQIGHVSRANGVVARWLEVQREKYMGMSLEVRVGNVAAVRERRSPETMCMP